MDDDRVTKDRSDFLRAGIALFNDSYYLAAHEPWEESWLTDPRGDRDDCLQGLVQAAGAIHHAFTDNPDGARGLSGSAPGYLENCDESHVPVTDLRAWLDRLHTNPELVLQEDPPRLAFEGSTPILSDLQFPAAGIAAEALAETRDDDQLEYAVEYAEHDLAEGRTTSPFVSLVLDYLAEGGPLVRTRLEQHVDRRRSKDEDVAGLFESE